jgi:hypothetical protein
MSPRRAVPLLVIVAIVFFAFAASAYAGHASTGKLNFYPCTDCHPVILGPDDKPIKPLPNGMKKHEIVLEKHDILGEGDTACLACHDKPSKNPGKLLLPDGTFVDVNGDTSRVCQRCHFEKYEQFKAGIHGKHMEKCTSAGCHDPHTPSWIYVAALPPFQGTGMEVKAVGISREPFRPFASPPVPPPVYTPTWMVVVAVLGFLMVVSIVSYLVFGRSKT